ncbi:MAG: hypothetical protein N2Z22_06280 [Turneriella sp.]|nr:hypothetical protein [Turneriella sp.]
MDKAAQRQLFRAAAQQFFAQNTQDTLAGWHRSIAAALREYCDKNFSMAERKSCSVAVYRPLRYELPSEEIATLSGAWHNPRYLYPQTEGKNMYFIDGTGKIAIPDFVIVPGLLVDPQGNRLGRGGGFYDRYLREKQVPLPRRIFLGYPFQFVAAVTVGPDDERVTPIRPQPGIWDR